MHRPFAFAVALMAAGSARADINGSVSRPAPTPDAAAAVRLAEELGCRPPATAEDETRIRADTLARLETALACSERTTLSLEVRQMMAARATTEGDTMVRTAELVLSRGDDDTALPLPLPLPPGLPGSRGAVAAALCLRKRDRLSAEERTHLETLNFVRCGTGLLSGWDVLVSAEPATAEPLFDFHARLLFRGHAPGLADDGVGEGMADPIAAAQRVTAHCAALMPVAAAEVWGRGPATPPREARERLGMALLVLGGCRPELLMALPETLDAMVEEPVAGRIKVLRFNARHGRGGPAPRAAVFYTMFQRGFLGSHGEWGVGRDAY